MGIVNHTAWTSQTRQSQPSWLILVAFYLLAAHGLYAASLLVGAVWPGWTDWFGRNYDTGRMLWAASQAVVTLGGTALLLRRYGSALNEGFALNGQGVWRILKFGLAFGLALAAYYVWQTFWGLKAFVAMTDAVAEGARPLDQAFWARLHQSAWQPLAYGTDRLGVVLATFISFAVAPLLEETVINGYAFNKASRRLPLVPAAVLCATLFATLHLHKTGLSMQLLLVFLLGCTSLSARLASGSWLAGVVAHLAVNTAIFVPKWLAALAWFYVEARQ